MPITGDSPALERLEASEPHGFPMLVDRYPASASILRGCAAILSAMPALCALAARCGQTGEVDQLPYFLDTPDARRKTPWLVLVRADTPQGDDVLTGAVLLFEYQTLLGRTRVFSSADGTGRRNVLAPPDERPRVAAIAAQALMDRGARIVHLALNQDHHDSLSVAGENAARWTALRARSAIAVEHTRRPAKARGLVWAMHEQEMPLYLPLAATYEQTLARIGQKTRANLRYYRKRCEAEFGCTFTADVRLALDEFLAFNRQCTYAVSDELAAWRFKALGEGTFLCGIREAAGPWLSLVGGRRQNGYAEIDWQMNRADLPASSLSTVVRAYLIEDEVRRGTTRLYIEGGTPHSMRGSFASERVFELTVKRNSAAVRFLERFAPVVFPPKNYLAQTLVMHDLVWNRW